MNKKPLIGFIGQGWIGRNYSDDFESRGYSVVRYSLEAEYASNKDKIAECDIVFIAVPTPTTPDGFSESTLRQVLPIIGKNKIAVIKSTVIMGTTQLLQNDFPEAIILNSPEFLSESTAAHDAANPDRNIIGIPVDNEIYRNAAKQVLSVLPKAPYELVCSSEEAEFIKYSHNIHGYLQVVFSNILFDIAAKRNMDWKVLKEAFRADPMMSHRYLNPVHKSGRGAGGHCFIKDMEAFIRFFDERFDDRETSMLLKAMRDKNNQLLISTNKDIDLLEVVYGPDILNKS